MNGSRGTMKVVYNEYDWNIILMSVINLLLFNCDSDDVMKIVKILLMMTMMAMVTTVHNVHFGYYDGPVVKS